MNGQVSLEAMLMIMLIFVIFATVFFIAQENDSIVIAIKERLEAKRVCDKFSSEVHALLLLGHGSESTIRTEKDIVVSNMTVLTDSFLCRICCVSRNSSTSFNLTAGIITLRNVNGEIVV